MNKKIIIANWKMNLSLRDSIKLAKQYRDRFIELKKGENTVVVCPDFVSLCSISDIFKDSPLKLGAQNISAYNNGAYTGDVLGKSLSEIGCQYVIIGHSERRNIFKENNEDIRKKIKSAVNNNLKPIVCIGENIKCRKDGKVKDFLGNQLKEAFIDSNIRNNDIIVAYEPIWAIGTGNVIKREDIVEVSKYVKDLLLDIFNREKLENNFKFIYGGSINSDNMSDFIDDVDGFLVGGSSLSDKEFFKIVVNSAKVEKI